MKKSSFVEYVVEDLLSEIEEVSAKAMFGGYGLYGKRPRKSWTTGNCSPNGPNDPGK